MKSTQVEHTSFVVERELQGSPRHAFRFWSDQTLKARWTGCHADWVTLEERFDFRVGGSEAKCWLTPQGDELTFNAVYLDIVEGERIIYAYEMTFGGERLSASLVTVELIADGPRTKVKVTEQAAFLSGEGASAQRVAGTEEGFDRLVEVISAETETVQ